MASTSYPHDTSTILVIDSADSVDVEVLSWLEVIIPKADCKIRMKLLDYVHDSTLEYMDSTDPESQRKSTLPPPSSIFLAQLKPRGPPVQ